MSSLFDTDDDLSLRTRRGAEDRSRERAVEMADSPADREVTLNTGTVLALFFALALICAVFFGFGYSMGRKSTQAPVTAASSSTTDSSADDTASHNTASDKPAPGSPAIQPVPGYMSQQEANDANSKSTQSVATAPARPAAVAPAAPAPAHTAVATTTPAPVVRTAPPPAVPTPAAAPVTSAPAAPGSVFVQIAAVSHQEDADVLKSALGRRGYKVVERSDANDRLIHVQIGPFTDRKAAEATRQKLLSDGYNAFLK
ncbi:SPOR domain-containing protein [Terriglobus roseus]|uniref:Sporulation related domain-containing protein n=1 Tax=Terriglobus roseus TaxID=392734 RepID=A0A1G7M0J8_9BACT|nr:SPOR domain-containing protein [Terriglobus roseus]SDF54709.1 Sporulation related domain-containing protein [Terriglobus roseus]